MEFNLITEKWIPVVPREGGERCWIRPAEIAAAGDVDFAWGRADLSVATYELLIGLLSVAFAPSDDDLWRELLDTPPTLAELDAAFAPLRPWFNLDGNGPRFMQDFEAFEGEQLSCDALFIDAPGANTLRNGCDLFVKSDRMPVLSREAATIALYALQSFAPTGGAGHRTSMRGGGPLTTLIRGERRASLWYRIWLNVSPAPNNIVPLPDDLTSATQAALVFPWCATTKSSKGGKALRAGEGHPLQAYFGMPRRIRLTFAAHNDRPCALTSDVDERSVTGFTMKSHGINYDESWNARGWRHPLTPYYQPKTGGGTELPVHPKSSRLGYRQWVGLIYRQEARSGRTGEGRGISRNLEWLSGQRRLHVSANVLAAGYVMDNMKVLDYVEAEFPLILAADGEMQQELELFAHRLVSGADFAAGVLRSALRASLDAGTGATILEGPIESVWSATEQPFRDTMRDFAKLADVDVMHERIQKFCETWRTRLERTVLDTFDRAVPPENLIAKRPSEQAAIINARKGLVLTLRGYGKGGRAFFNTLSLTPRDDGKSENIKKRSAA